jgi:signal peptide peptidase SppA
MQPDLLRVPAFNRATEYAGAWAIEPSAAAALWERARRTDLVAHVEDAKPAKLRSEVATVAVAPGQSVAVVIIAGTMMKVASSLDGGTSTALARREIRKAADDPAVSGILLHIDSPGGTVSGTADLAAEVRSAGVKKPVYAFIEDTGASAAYWVASQAEKVFANDRTALVGSIGTLAVVYDLSKAAETAGVKTLVFGTGPLKGAGAPGAPVTEDQQAYIRSIVDDAQVSFDEAVRKGRGFSAKQLTAAKTGGVFGATEALSMGLIDGIKSYDAVIADLAGEARRKSRASNTRAAGPVPQRSVTMNETATLAAAGTTAGAPATFNADTDAHVAAVVKAQNAATAANLNRIAGIQKVAAKHPDIAAKAVEENWTVEKTELASMKADLAASPVRSAGPNFVFGKEKLAAGVGLDAVLEAGLSRSMGVRDVEKRYKPEVLEAADAHYRGLGLQQVIMLAAAANGYAAGPGQRITDGNIREVLGHAFPQRGAATSTVSLPGILGNVANKEIRTGYMEDDQTWREVAAVKSVSNFQAATSYRLLDSMEYEELGPDGKIKHGSVSEESYTRQAKTYAKMFSLTRRDIINDDLGAFQDLRTRIGRGSAKKFNNVFWTEFLSDASTFWTAARTNYISGATTNLGLDGVGLGLGVKAFRVMTSPSADGAKRVGGQPDRLLVPPELESIARTLYIANNGTAVKASDVNIYANLYRPVVVPWLSDSNFTGYSTLAWYLMRNPADMAAVVVSFLNGNETPTVESADADFDTLGVQFRGYHDFGCDQAEYLAGVKSKGGA